MSRLEEPTKRSLAGEIQEATRSRIEFAAIDQPVKIFYCNGPEQTVEYFLEALVVYPPAVFRVPFSIVLLEVAGLSRDGKSRRRKAAKLMKQISNVIRYAVGPGDILVRYGFNHFAMLMPGLDEVAAAKICQRIKEAIHHYLYVRMKRHVQLELEFALSQHNPLNGEDVSELVFSNEQSICLARALGDGAVVLRSEAKDRFQNHHKFSFRLGETFHSSIIRSSEDLLDH